MGTARTIPVWDDITARTADWWQETPPAPDCDVIVVGAGIAGLTTALCLLREGRQVLIVDRDGVGAGETLRTSAHLASALDDRFSVLARYHGRDGARLAASSHAAAIDWIGTLAAGDPACGFRRIPGYLFACDGDDASLEREGDAAARAGLPVELLRDGVAGLPALGPALRFESQARISIGGYLLHLARSVRQAGARFLRAEATAIEGGERPSVELRDGTRLRAQAVVSAANVPFHRTGVAWLKQAAYRTYVVAGHAPRDAIPDALYWDNGDPYHYVRLLDDPGADEVRVLVGGEDHKVGQDDDPESYVRLQAWARRHFPSITHFTAAWSGQILEPADGLAFAGADPGHDNVYLVTGDSGNGLTHGTLGALLLCDLIQGRDNPWAELYDPARRRWASAGPFLRENLNSGSQYRDWIAPADIDNVADLTPGNGAVIRRGLRRIAVYRDGEGRLHAHDARCTHMGCVVRWSREEKSWDCPCHGSRFEAVTGAILNGPASEPLARCDLEDADAGHRD